MFFKWHVVSRYVEFGVNALSSRTFDFPAGEQTAPDARVLGSRSIMCLHVEFTNPFVNDENRTEICF